MTLERVIFDNVVHNEDYARKVIPFLKGEYFHNREERVVFELIDSFINKYNSIPTKEALSIDLDEYTGLSEDSFSTCKDIISSISYNPDNITELDWLLDQTEKFCQDKALYNAIMSSIQILDDKSGKTSKGMIPELLSNALAVTFDNTVGHEYVDEAEQRFDELHKNIKRLPFDIEYLNKITKGGLPPKTLNIILAGTGVGKTLCMCHMAAMWMMMGYNVLYITLEMSQEKIAERIDCNLLNVTIDDLAVMPKEIFERKVSRIGGNTNGKLIVKEYPTATAHVGNFRHLINELKLKKKFKPDVIVVDYLNICMSQRIRVGGNVNSYTYVKAIAEELRGLAVECNVPVLSATQTTRSGFTNSDPGLEDTSESFGLPATADFMIVIVSNEQLEALKQIMFKQLKNRYADPNLYKRFVVGVDKPKMRLYDVEDNAQDLIDDSPVFDNTPSSDSPSKFDRVKIQDFI